MGMYSLKGTLTNFLTTLFQACFWLRDKESNTKKIMLRKREWKDIIKSSVKRGWLQFSFPHFALQSKSMKIQQWEVMEKEKK